MNITKTTLDRIETYRTEYLQSLPEFQELFIELMINKSDCYSFQIDRLEIGYAIRNNEGVLIEFYVKNNHIPKSNYFFNMVLKELSITDIYCKSFDSLLLSNCILNTLSYSVIGVLYRDYVGAKIKIDLSIEMKKANLSSKELLLKQDDSLIELYETEQMLTDFLIDENVFTFYKNKEFIGCGMVIRTKADKEYCDLGVWVNPKNRGFGIGAQIIIHLREFALNQKLKPSCGCAIENIASQKTIEKSGFVSKYNLINFKAGSER